MAALLLALTACGSKPPQAGLPPLPALQTVVARAADDPHGRSWDGVVEAVQQAVLTAQTSGRVVAVDVDLNDRVVAGQVLLRLSAVEQQAGANTARAQLRAAEAAAVEAEANYRRFAALAADRHVSRAQIEQARASRDSANAAREVSRSVPATIIRETPAARARSRTVERSASKLFQ